ncbi:MAG: hypothetical protein EOP51_10505 [Sphingobacteriales bacterium]|nr:MAG: hypothetical protein EOP51_10505 [Sphingobacteriales bacterium]
MKNLRNFAISLGAILFCILFSLLIASFNPPKVVVITAAIICGVVAIGGLVIMFISIIRMLKRDSEQS